jgi:hypothetical protein
MRRSRVFIAAAIGGAVTLGLLAENNILLSIVVGAGVGAAVVLFFYVYPRHVGYAERRPYPPCEKR